MMIRCLRALPTAMAEELGEPGGIFLTEPGELLSIPVHTCREQNNPACQCRRIFVGISSGNPTSLARVCLAHAQDVDRECAQSGAVEWLMVTTDQDRCIPLVDLREIADAVRQFEVGAVVQVNRIDEKICIEDACCLRSL